MKSWMFPWASLYVFQIAIGMAVWSFLYGSASVIASAVIGLVFAVLGVVLWMSKPRFNNMVAEAASEDAPDAEESPEQNNEE